MTAKRTTIWNNEQGSYCFTIYIEWQTDSCLALFHIAVLFEFIALKYDHTIVGCVSVASLHKALQPNVDIMTFLSGSELHVYLRIGISHQIDFI